MSFTDVSQDRVDRVMAFSGSPRAPFDVIIVDADPGQRRAFASQISARASNRFTPMEFASAAAARSAIQAGGDVIVIADLDTIGGPERLCEIADTAVPLIATGTNGSLTAAVAAIRGGAIDFLPKPVGARLLIERLEAAIERRQPARAPTGTPAPAPVHNDFAGFVGRAPAMRAVYDQIRRMAPSRAPVFITGESGTGKELAAEAIHQYSGRGERPLVAINCSAIPKDLMESEIFGHVRGAFTGATDNHVGAAERADAGTLFLDEVAEMDLGLQAKMLRFLQSGAVQRVGGGELKRVDVRIVCATNRDPLVEVGAGRFRADLFYRMHVLPIHLPPLRQRREDVMLLAESFLARFAEEEGRRFRTFDENAAARLVGCDWPGNVRQLANLIRRIVVLSDGVTVDETMLPARIGTSNGAGAAPSEPPQAIGPLWQHERQVIESALAAFGGNIARAAAALEVSPSTIYRKRQSWSRGLRAG